MSGLFFDRVHSMTNGKMTLRAGVGIKIAGWATLILSSFVLTSCGGSLPDLNKMTGNIFKKKEVILPGKREAVLKSRTALATSSEAANIAVTIPATNANTNWSQPGGNASNALGHLVYGGKLRSAWTASAGQGSTSDGQLISRPIVYNGRIYTLDTEGMLSSFSANGGSVAFRVRLTPQTEEKNEGYGGGLAASDGRLYAATGYGTVVGLDAKTGKILWTKTLGVPVRTSPTAANGKVFVVTTEGRLYALSGTDGEEVWSQRGLPDRASILSNISPAVSGTTLVVPYSSGEITAYELKTGRALWRDSLATVKQGSSLASMANPGRPAISKGTVYAVSNSGRMIATSKKDGERLWSKSISSTQTPWPAGNMVYVADRMGRVIALSAKTGDVVWFKQLAKGERWLGPILAGERLWVVSDHGRVAGLNPKNGKILSQRDLGYSINIAPIIANGHMYILTDNAKLVALN